MTWNLTGRQLRTGMFGVAVILAGATVYWTSHPGQSIAPNVGLAASAAHAAPADARRLKQETMQAGVAFTPPRAEAVIADSEESTIAQYTAEKYQILLDDLRHLRADQIEQMHRALATRERLAGELKTARQAAHDSAAGIDLSRQEAALALAEDRIRGMLRPADYATYETLKESDLELFKLNEYAGGISNVAPLSADDRKSILRTKLAYKQRFRQLLLDSGLQRQDLSPAEREYAYSVTARALGEYKRNYLEEVRQYLSNAEQYALLSNYEDTEFNAELTGLQSLASAASADRDLPAQGGS